MSSKHVWRVADAGVMLWQPATETTLDLTLQEPLEPWYNLIEDDIQGKWLSFVPPFNTIEQVLMVTKLLQVAVMKAMRKRQYFLQSKRSLKTI